MQRGLVTIIIPCYNGEKYLHNCMESILEQDYDEVQVIIVDDGSVDNSKAIIFEYEARLIKKGYSFQYIYQNNQGAASAVNKALPMVEGEYLELFDVDDRIYKNNISKKVRAFENNESIGIVINDGYFLNEDSGEKERFYQDIEYIDTHGLVDAFLFEHAYNWPGTYMVRTSMFFKTLKDNSIYVSPYGQNLQVILPVAYSYDCFIIREALMDYLVRKDSVSHTDSIEKELWLQKGFTENRIETIKRLKIDQEKIDDLVDRVNKWDSRKRFVFSMNNGLKEELKTSRNELKKYNDYHIKDRVRYLVGNNKFLKKMYDKLHIIKQG